MILTGTDGIDLLVGGVDADVLYGLGGFDQLEGRGGNDLLDGGDGNDELSGGIGDDTARGGAGNDRFMDQDIDSAGDDSLDGGAGDDRFEDHLGNNTLVGGDGADSFLVWMPAGGSNLATGGAGSDTWRVRVPDNTAADNVYTVTDFQAGAGGDRMDVRDLLSFSVANGRLLASNPFDPAVGTLQLVQSGADTLLQWDRDGRTVDGFPWFTVLTLRNVQAVSLVAANFLGGIPLDGSPVAGRTIEGSADPDYVDGWLGNDTLYGLGGNDVFNRVISPDGSLVWATSFGDDTLYGGEGDDTLIDWVGDNVFYGGAGDDLFSVYSGDGGSNVLTGGAGRDTYQPFGAGFTLHYRVTDFTTGASGDRIDLMTVLQGIAGVGNYAQGNPFDPVVGIFRLVQSGPDTLVEADQDGAAGSAQAWVTLLTLANVQSGALTSDNFTGPLHPDGSAGAAGRLDGTGSADTLDSDFDDDLVYGLAGNDTLRGSGGDDSLYGGEGGDWLQGGLGSDVMDGGAGDDVFSIDGLEFAGDDQLLGGPGNDLLGDFAGQNLLRGGDGNDTLTVWDNGSSFADNTLSGGAGRDVYDVGYNADSIYRVSDFAAGAGGDQFDVDRILEHSGLFGAGKGYTDGNPFTQGYLRFVRSGTGALLQVDLDAAGTSYAWATVLTLQGVDPARITSDNFAGQFIVGTEGADTLVGGLGNDTIEGLGGDDQLAGAEGRDTMDGGSGIDTMTGGAGGDTYYVDNRADVVIEDAPTAQGFAAPDAAAAMPWPGPLATGSNIDTVIAQVSYTLRANIENLQLAGSGNLVGAGNALDNLLSGNSGANRLSGFAGQDLLDGGGGADTLDGGPGRDTLGGGAGADVLVGGDGNDKLAGGAGADVFLFDAALSAGANRDTLADFTPGSDVLRLDDDVFRAFDAGVATTLAPGAFRAGAGVTAAGDAGDRIVYNTSTGALYYDPDGSGATAAVQFATLGTSNHPELTAADFRIVG